MRVSIDEESIPLPRRLCRSFLRDGSPVLDLDAQLPEIKGAVLLNAYYDRFYRQLTGYIANSLVPDLPERGKPLQLSLDYQVRLATSALLSITLDLTRRDGRNMPAARFSSVWSRGCGMLLPLKAFFPTYSAYRKLRSWIRSRALERLGSGYCLYDPHQADRADKLFSSENFYASEKGLVLFFPPLTLGGAAEGIPEFLLPWDPSGPILPES